MTAGVFFFFLDRGWVLVRSSSGFVGSALLISILQLLHHGKTGWRMFTSATESKRFE